MKRFFILLVCGLVMSAMSVSGAKDTKSPQTFTFTQLQTAFTVAGTCGCDVDLYLFQSAPPPTPPPPTLDIYNDPAMNLALRIAVCRNSDVCPDLCGQRLNSENLILIFNHIFESFV